MSVLVVAGGERSLTDDEVEELADLSLEAETLSGHDVFILVR